MKENFKKTKFRIVKILRSHQVFVSIMVLLLVSLAVVLRIRQLNELGADQAYIEEHADTVKSVNFNQKAIQQIEALRDSNVATPGTQLPGDRDNPFSE